jgi:hypothetical protein
MSFVSGTYIADNDISGGGEGSFFSHIQVIGCHYADRFLLRLWIAVGVITILRDDSPCSVAHCTLNSLF